MNTVIISSESCLRRRIEIDGIDSCIIVGEDFTHISTPRENDANLKPEPLDHEVVRETELELRKLLKEGKK